MGLEMDDPDRLIWAHVLRDVWRTVRSAPHTVAANLITLVGVLLFGWNAMAVFLMFFAENAIILALETLRGLMRPMKWSKRIGDPMAMALILGVFLAAQLGFVIFAVARNEFTRINTGGPFGDVAAYMASFDLGWPIALLAGAHAWRFAWKLRHQRGFRQFREGPATSIFRMFAGQMFVILSLPPTFLLGSPVWALVILLIIKTALDIALERFFEHA